MAEGLDAIMQEKELREEVLFLSGLHPRDIAAYLKGMDGEEARKVFDLFDAELASAVLVELEDQAREELIAKLGGQRLAEVIRDEQAPEDIYRMVGLDEHEKVFEPAFVSVRKRVPWLLLGLVAVSCAAAFVYAHEKTILKRPILTMAAQLDHSRSER
jgi:Mg/Co/Ni transporter MgtE